MRKGLWFCVLLLSLTSCKKFEKESFVKTGDVVIVSSLHNAIGSIVDVGENGIEDYGHCWSLNAEPTVADRKSSFGATTETGVFESKLTHLWPDTTYYYRSYIIEDGEVKYGENKTFISGNIFCNIEIGNIEILNSTTISVNGELSDFGSFYVSAFGHIISMEQLPDFEDEHSVYGETESDTNFVSTFENLVTGVTYYVRSYVTFSYGNGNISLLVPPSSFTIEDLVVNSLTHTIPLPNYAQLEGDIESLGYNPVTEHGFCWSNSTASPDYNSTRIELGAATATGSFFGTLANMQGGATYYWRAYAVANGVVKYGSIKTIVN